MKHGGDLRDLIKRYNISRSDCLDLSTGINPTPYPINDLPDSCWEKLPDRAVIGLLEAAAINAYGAGNGAAIVSAPGTQSLIQLLPSLKSCCRVKIVSPTYSEHCIAWRAAGHLVEEIENLDATDTDVIIVVNPNNPDGRQFEPSELIQVAKNLERNSGLLVVDEAFMDLHPKLSIVPYINTQNIVVLKSFGKFFGLAGLRLGFAIGNKYNISKLRSSLGPWAVSGPSAVIGKRALSDQNWIEDTVIKLSQDANAMENILRKHRLKIVGRTNLFQLVEVMDAVELQHNLAREGIWTRVFDYSPNWIRFGLPSRGEAMDRLDCALEKITRVGGNS